MEASIPTIIQSLERIGEVMRSERRKACLPEGLSNLQAEILTYLAAHADAQVTPALLASYFRITRPTISDALASLMKKSLISMSVNPHDKRSHMLSLTHEGCLLASALRQRQLDVAAHLERLAPDLCAQLDEGLKLLLHHMAEPA